MTGNLLLLCVKKIIENVLYFFSFSLSYIRLHSWRHPFLQLKKKENTFKSHVFNIYEETLFFDSSLFISICVQQFRFPYELKLRSIAVIQRCTCWIYALTNLHTPYIILLQNCFFYEQSHEIVNSSFSFSKIK